MPKKSTKAASVRKKTYSSADRPLNNFNLYYILERERALQTDGIVPDASSSGSGVINFSDYADLPSQFPPRPFRYQHLVLPSDWFMHGKKKTRDSSRRTMGLVNMTRSIVASWKDPDLDKEIRDYVNTVAALVKQRRDQIRLARDSVDGRVNQEPPNMCSAVVKCQGGGAVFKAAADPVETLNQRGVKVTDRSQPLMNQCPNSVSTMVHFDWNTQALATQNYQGVAGEMKRIMPRPMLKNDNILPPFSRRSSLPDLPNDLSFANTQRRHSLPGLPVGGNSLSRDFAQDVNVNDVNAELNRITDEVARMNRMNKQAFAPMNDNEFDESFFHQPVQGAAVSNIKDDSEPIGLEVFAGVHEWAQHLFGEDQQKVKDVLTFDEEFDCSNDNIGHVDMTHDEIIALYHALD